WQSDLTPSPPWLPPGWLHDFPARISPWCPVQTQASSESARVPPPEESEAGWGGKRSPRETVTRRRAGGPRRLGLPNSARARRRRTCLQNSGLGGFPGGPWDWWAASCLSGPAEGESQKRGPSLLSLLLLPPSLPSRRPAPVSRLGGDVASRAGGPARLFLLGRGSGPAPRPDAGTRGASPPRPCGRRPARSAPGPSMLPELKKYGVTTLVRVCDATYDKAPVEKEGIQVLDWPFDDGAPPPGEIVEDWLNLLKTKFREEPGCCVAVHCVAGLGRAPVLVALALIECGMKYEDAVQFIRQKRRGAFNSKQLLYLEKYRPKMRLRFRDANGHCIVHLCAASGSSEFLQLLCQ
uniref:Protein tyrosine phosphatase 4A2 n=1 Tax=Naja naja TaxID=35670 RepID=A0A8C6YBS4_NAJNA